MTRPIFFFFFWGLIKFSAKRSKCSSLQKRKMLSREEAPRSLTYWLDVISFVNPLIHSWSPRVIV